MPPPLLPPAQITVESDVQITDSERVLAAAIGTFSSAPLATVTMRTEKFAEPPETTRTAMRWPFGDHRG